MAGIQNSGVFQHGPGRHLFLVCTAKSWSRERGCGGTGEGGRRGKEEEEEERGFRGVFFPWGRYLRGFKGGGGRGVMEPLICLVSCIVPPISPHLTFSSAITPPFVQYKHPPLCQCKHHHPLGSDTHRKCETLVSAVPSRRSVGVFVAAWLHLSQRSSLSAGCLRGNDRLRGRVESMWPMPPLQCFNEGIYTV